MPAMPTHSSAERQVPLHPGELLSSAATSTAHYDAYSVPTTSAGEVVLALNQPPTAQLTEPLTIDEEIELMTKPGQFHPDPQLHWQESLQLTDAEYNALAARPFISPIPSPRYDVGFEFEFDPYCTYTPGGGDNPSGVPWKESGGDASTNAPTRDDSDPSRRPRLYCVAFAIGLQPKPEENLDSLVGETTPHWEPSSYGGCEAGPSTLLRSRSPTPPSRDVPAATSDTYDRPGVDRQGGEDDGDEDPVVESDGSEYTPHQRNRNAHPEAQSRARGIPKTRKRKAVGSNDQRPNKQRKHDRTDCLCRVFGCTHVSKTPHECRKHRDTHFGGRFRCPGCLGIYQRCSALKRHLEHTKSDTCAAAAGPPGTWGTNMATFETHPPEWLAPGVLTSPDEIPR